MNKVTCFQCNGFRELFHRDGSSLRCDMCQGTGMMKDKHVLWKLQGEMLQEQRKKLGLTLRKASIKYNIDASNLSKMERGIIKPKNYFNDNKH